MVLGGQHQILHAGFGGEIEPRLRVEAVRAELVEQLRILPGRNAVTLLLLLVQAVDRVQSPVDEHSQPPLEKPVAAVIESLHIVSHFSCVWMRPNPAALRKFCAVPNSISWVLRFA